MIFFMAGLPGLVQKWHLLFGEFLGGHTFMLVEGKSGIQRLKIGVKSMSKQHFFGSYP